MAGVTLPRPPLVIATRPWGRAGRGGWPRGLALLVASLPLLALIGLPLLALVARVSLANVLAHLLDREVAQAVALSFVTTLATTAITLLLGTPIAYLLARRQFKGRTALDTLIDLPMVLPPSVAGIALLLAFGRRGLFGQYLDDFGLTLAFTQTAVILAQLFVAAPYYVKSAISGFSSVDQELEQAASLDGGSPWQVFRLICLPLAGPSLFGGAVMTWARALGEFGATIIFAGNFPGRTQTMPLAIYIGFELNLNVALTLSAILLALSFVVLFVMKRVLRRQVTVH